MLNECFTKKFTTPESPIDIGEFSILDGKNCPADLLCTEEVFTLISNNIDPSKSSGPENIYSYIMESVKDQSLISDKQWGFMKGKSTLGALLTAVENWHRQLESGTMCVQSFFLTLRRLLTHTLLLKKLSTLGLFSFKVDCKVPYTLITICWCQR